MTELVKRGRAEIYTGSDPYHYIRSDRVEMIRESNGDLIIIVSDEKGEIWIPFNQVKMVRWKRCTS